MFVTLCLMPSVLGLQSFLETPTYSEVNRGSSVVLQCYVLGKGGECRWEKDGNPVGIFREKYEWAGKVESGNCSLVIMDASSEYDDGVWQCQVTASNFKEGEPDENGEEDCVCVDGNGGWNDNSCYKRLQYFFVEFDV